MLQRRNALACKFLQRYNQLHISYCAKKTPLPDELLVHACYTTACICTLHEDSPPSLLGSRKERLFLIFILSNCNNFQAVLLCKQPDKLPPSSLHLHTRDNSQKSSRKRRSFNACIEDMTTSSSLSLIPPLLPLTHPSLSLTFHTPSSHSIPHPLISLSLSLK